MTDRQFKPIGVLFLLLISVPRLWSQTASSTAAWSLPPALEVQIPKDPPQVRLRLLETVSSANASLGQSILFEVIEPVAVDGKKIVLGGAHAHASVSVVRHRGHNRREGKLLLTVQSVSLADGREANLQSAILRKGSGEGMPIFGPCTFPIPADPVGLFRKGNDVVIPKGTELVAPIVLPAP